MCIRDSSQQRICGIYQSEASVYEAEGTKEPHHCTAEEPVSYTHLDVYKRQDNSAYLGCEHFFESGCCIFVTIHG